MGILKKLDKTTGSRQRQAGYLLAEVVTALAVLGIFLLALVPLTSDTFRNMVRAGQRSQQVLTAQGNMALVSASSASGTGITLQNVLFPVHYTTGSTANVSGKKATQNGITAGFFYASNMPIIEISPNYLEEGYAPGPLSKGITGGVRITVYSQNFTFNSSTTVTVRSQATGQNVAVSNVTVDSTNRNKLTFILPRGLTNFDSPYEVMTTTPRNDGSGETDVATATLQVGLPAMMAVGNKGLVLISSGNGGAEEDDDQPGLYWQVRDAETTEDLNGAACSKSGDTWVVVGENGTIRVWKDGAGKWEKITLPGSPDLNAVTYFERDTGGDVIQMFAAVGDGGVIYTSSADGLTWTKHEISDFSKDLYDICSSWDTDPTDSIDDSRMVAVGKSGAVVYSTDGINWKENRDVLGKSTRYSVIGEITFAEYNLKAVAFADENPKVLGGEAFWTVGYYDGFLGKYAAAGSLGKEGTEGSVELASSTPPIQIGWIKIITPIYADFNELVYFYAGPLLFGGDRYVYVGDSDGMWWRNGVFTISDLYWYWLSNISSDSLTAAVTTPETGYFFIVTDRGKIYQKTYTAGFATRVDNNIANGTRLNDISVR